MIFSRTPFRISLFRGGTDYPIQFCKHGETAFATAIDKYLYINVLILPPFFIKFTNEIDEIYNAGIAVGALGGKFLSAGGGGFMPFMVEPENRVNLKRRL